MQDLEKSLANWSQNLKELHTMKADLAAHVLAEDTMALKEQIEHLHRQWEDLCLRVSRPAAGHSGWEATEKSPRPGASFGQQQSRTDVSLLFQQN